MRRCAHWGSLATGDFVIGLVRWSAWWSAPQQFGKVLARIRGGTPWPDEPHPSERAAHNSCHSGSGWAMRASLDSLGRGKRSTIPAKATRSTFRSDGRRMEAKKETAMSIGVTPERKGSHRQARREPVRAAGSPRGTARASPDDRASYAGILCTNPAGRRLWKLVAKGFRSG